MTYWHYTYEIIVGNNLSFGYGIEASKYEFFDFLTLHQNFPNHVIISVTQISKEQYENLNDHIKNAR